MKMGEPTHHMDGNDMKWILMVLVLNNGDYETYPPTYQEFDTVLACKKAETVVDQSYQERRGIRWQSLCIPKGDLK